MKMWGNDVDLFGAERADSPLDHTKDISESGHFASMA